MVFHITTCVLYVLVATGIAAIPIFFIFLPSFFQLFLELVGLIFVKLAVKR